MAADQLAVIQGQELSNVVLAYLIVGAIGLALAAVILFIKFPKKSDEGFGSMGASFKRLIKDKQWIASVVAQFFYVGTQIGVWTFAVAYIMENHAGIQSSLTPEKDAGQYVFYGLCIYAAFRFICTFLMSYISAPRLLLIMAVIAAVLSSVVVFAGGMIGVYALIAIFPCMSLMFPTIYGIGLSNVEGDDRKLGGAVIIMSIIGGAILVPIQANIIDSSGSAAQGYILPLIGFAIVIAFSILTRKARD